MIITSIKVDNFKSLLNLDVSKLENVNLIYGYNNSGKSNLLKFLEIVFKKKTFESISTSTISVGNVIRRREVIEETDFYRGEIYNYPFYYFKNEWNVSGAMVTFEIGLSMTKEELKRQPYLLDNALYKEKDIVPAILKGRFIPKDYDAFEIELNEVSLDSNIIYSFSAGATRFFPTLKQGVDSELSRFLQQFNDAVLLIDSDRYFQDETFDYSVITDLNSKNLKQWYYYQSIDYTQQDQIKVIEKFVNGFSISDPEEDNPNFANLPFKGEITIKKLADNIEVFLKNGNLNLPVKNFGTGVQQIFYILTKICACNAKIILIEEFELNLSKRYQVEFLKYLKTYLDKKGKQLIFTTHSPYIAEERGIIDSHFEVAISKDGITSITHQQRGESGYKDWIINH